MDYLACEVLVNALANQTGAAPFLALSSETNLNVVALMGLLPPVTPFLVETGILEDLMPDGHS